jgi:predicted transcriptional regulator
MMKGLFGRSWRGGLVGSLGHLEAEVMEIVWGGGEAAVRDVQRRLARPIAYTTVMTTLDRLFKKGYVRRRLEGRAFLYTAAFAKRELEVSVTSDLLKDLLSRNAPAAPVLSNLVDAVADRNDGLLDELERLVREKRERLKRDQR